MSTTQTRPEAIDRSRVIDLLRGAMLERIGEDQSACRWAAEKGIFCRGFAQFDDQELRSKYSWIMRRRPKLTRPELEEIADHWQLARQEVGGQPIACDVQQREHDMCRGWDDFTNEQLARFLFEITGTSVVVM